MTHKLWTESKLDEWNEPAAPANLRVYHAATRKDFLIVYDEHSERHDSIRTRAFFLNPNLVRLTDRCAPYFVRPDMSAHLTALPVFPESGAWGSHAPARPFVVSGTNAQSFTLHFEDGEPVEYLLPVYADNIGNYERVALTPVAVTEDTTIIGGVIGIWWLYMAAPGLGR